MNCRYIQIFLLVIGGSFSGYSQSQNVSPEYVLHISDVFSPLTGLKRVALEWVRIEDFTEGYESSFYLTKDNAFLEYASHYRQRKYPADKVVKFSPGETYGYLWVNQGIYQNLEKKTPENEGVIYPQLSLGFPFDVDKGQTLVEVVEEYDLRSAQFTSQFDLLVSKLNENEQNHVVIEGSASNVFFGMNCQDWTVDSMCTLLANTPSALIGLMDCDKGGEMNLTECLNNRNPFNENDDIDDVENETIAAITSYNQELAGKRADAGLEFFQAKYKSVNNLTTSFSRVSTKTKVTEKSFRSQDDRFNFNQSVLFNFYIYE